MSIIDFAIESLILTTAGWLAIEFIKFSSRRGSARRVAPAIVGPTEDELFNALADFGPGVAAGLMTQQEAVEIVYQHQVLPFRRPATRPQPSAPTDRELIELAKSCGYPGSQKWSYSRRISAKVRAILLETWEAIERTKAV